MRAHCNDFTILEGKMKSILERLDLPLEVVWAPTKDAQIRGEIENGIIFIYDEEEKMAVETFEHEVYEYKFKEVTRLHRLMVNALIDIIEKEIYNRKELFFDFLPKFQEAFESIKKCCSNSVP